MKKKYLKLVSIIFVSILLFSVVILGVTLRTNKSLEYSKDNSNLTFTTSVPQTLLSTSTPNAYEGWKEYRNEEYGLSVKVPDKYKITQDYSLEISCEDAKLYTKITNCKSEVSFKTLNIRYNTLNEIQIRLPSSNLGGDCPNAIRNKIDVTIFNMIRNISICKYKDGSLSTDPSAYFIVDSNSKVSQYTKLLISFKSTDNTNLQEILDILKSISIF